MTGPLIFLAALAIIGGWMSLRGGRGPARFLVVVWGLLLVCGFTAPPVIWLSLFALALLMAVVAATAAKSWRVAAGSLLATLALGAAFGAISFSRYREMSALLDKYPPVSVADRLAYESRGDQPGQGGTALATAAASGDEDALPDPIGGEVKRLEGRLYDWSGDDGRLSRRPYALARLTSLHKRMVYDFTIAEGFGVGRMSPRGVRREYIEIPGLPTLAVPDRSEPVSGETPSLAADDRAEPAAANGQSPAGPDHDALRTAHETGVVDFANRTGFGYIASREQVFGFQPHGFRTLPEIGGGSDANSRWQIASLELVSLLKHEIPAAYVSKNLPRMDELSAAPTRPLDDFETDALRQLRRGEELVVAEQPDELRMLGSLRAAKQCTECHAVSRGDLLGAFTYRLRRAAPVRPPRPSAVKPVS